ncbi:MAG: amino acid adenylation domain-containing protein [Bacteroidota bacterium]
MLTSDNIEDIYLLSPMQEGMYFHALMDSGSTAYCNQVSYRIHGDLDVTLVEDSFNELISRHAALRTVFNHKKKDTLLQVTLKEWPIKVHFEDIRHLSEEASSNHLADFKSTDLNTPFDLTEDKLMRIAVFQLASDQYELIWTHHHIIMDGWCLGILAEEFFEVYKSRLTGSPVALSQPQPYRRYIDWLNSKNHDHAREFWRNYLNNGEEQAQLPKKVKHGKQTRKNNLRRRIQLSEETTSKLNSLAIKHGVTLNHIISTLWGVGVSLFSGKQEVVFGAVVSGRPAEVPGIESIVGLFINTIPTRIRIAGAEQFIDIVKGVNEHSAAAQDYQYLPLAEIQSLSPLKHNLIDHIVIFENYPLDETLNGVEQDDSDGQKLFEFSDVEVVEETNYDLNVVVAPNEALILDIVYNAHVFDQNLINNLGDSLEVIIDQIIENPEVLIKDLEMINTNQKTQLLDQFQGASVPFPDKTISQWFEDQVVRTPDERCVVFQDHTLSYQQVNAFANQIAHVLIDRYDIREGDLVGIMMDKSEKIMPAMLGIMKAGAAYVPIDPNYPDERKQYLVEDSRIKVLICDDETNPAYIDNTLLIDSEEVENAESTNPSLNLATDKPAYVIYTSGTTGQPKGTIVGHEAAVNMFHWLIELAYQDKKLNVLASSSISFDASVQQLFPPLLQGSCLVLIPDHLKANPEAYLKACIKHNVEVNDIPPSYLKLVLTDHADLFGQLNLKYSFTGGELLQKAVKERYQNIFKGKSQLYNNYGLTETSVNSLFQRVDNSNFSEQSIGKPIYNTQIYILNQDAQMLPAGIRGEICIAGTGLGLGYLHRPELTERRFVDNPFKPGTKMYRTGDAGRWTSDGRVEFLGRIDKQIKIRGFRVEPGEIAETLIKHKAVKNAVVTCHEKGDDKYLIAYATLYDQVGTEALSNYLREQLPEYMVPGYMMILDQFPTTVHGKIDFDALPLPADATVEKSTSIQEPANPIETQLLAIWKEVLEKEAIGVTDNFFEIGGHSLKAIKIISRVLKTLEVNVELKDVFGYPTIRQLAKLIAELNGNQDSASPIQGLQPSAHYTPSHAQKRLWIIDNITDDKAVYNMPSAYVIEGQLDAQLLERSLLHLINRHESLRTAFIEVNEEPQQKIISPEEVQFQLEYQDLTKGDNALATAVKHIGEISMGTFDLSDAPLLKAGLLRLQDEHHAFYLNVHHIIADGWSMEVLVSELMHVYEALEQHAEITLPTLNVQYKDCTHWQNENLVGEEGRKAQAFWRKQFEGEIPVLELATDSPRPPIRTYKGETVEYAISSVNLEEINAFCDAHNVTLFAFLQAVINTLLYRYTGQNEIITGTVTAGRDHVDLENQIGLYANTLALKAKFKSDDQFEDLLKRIQTNTIEAFKYQHYPFDKLVEELNLQRDASRSPLFDVFVTLQNNALSTPPSMLGRKVDALESDFTVSKFDLSYIFREESDQLCLDINFNTDIFQADRIQRMAGHIDRLIGSVLEDSKQTITKLPYLGTHEKSVLIAPANEGAPEDQSQLTMVSLFERQAKTHAAEIAVVCRDNTLTYDELNRQANRFARHLMGKVGETKGKIIGLIGERNPEVMVAIMGILKAGATYMPLDPAYPIERLDYILDDAGVEHLILGEGIAPIDDLNHQVSLISMQEFLQTSNTWDEQNLDKDISPDDPAYLIYTSGSTGKPKGALVRHGSNVNMSLDQVQRFGVTSSDNVLQFASLSFDASVYEMFMSIYAGATLVIVPRDEIQDPELFTAYINAKETSVVTLPPSYLNALNLDQLQSLRVIITAGEAAKVEDAVKCASFADYYNAYGPTECAVCVSTYKVSAEDAGKANIPIGKPIANTSLYVLDDFMQLVGKGNVGELYVGGSGVALGYLNRPKMTAERFIDNPFVDGDRLYKTGDLVRMLPDGNLEFLGRKDNQVKLRGHRVELDEIENILNTSDAVGHAVVTLRKDRNQEDQLVAYYTGNEGADAKTLKTYLRQFLPEYMIPTHIIPIDKFPKTVSGKIDRKNLPDPTTVSSNGNGTVVLPENETEKTIKSIWLQVLGVEEVSVTDDFFEVGGNSLKIISLHKKVLDRFPDSITVADLFVYNSIRSLGEYIGTEELQENGITEGIEV